MVNGAETFKGKMKNEQTSVKLGNLLRLRLKDADFFVSPHNSYICRERTVQQGGELKAL